MHALHHARSSANKWGGEYNEYLPFHEFFDKSKLHCMDLRHRFWRHHSLGIQELVEKFGPIYVNSVGKHVPVQYIGEQHVVEDIGFIPSFADWVHSIPREKWMHSKPTSYRRHRALIYQQPASTPPPTSEVTAEA